MRTTLDIDDDVLQAAKELAAKRNTSAGRVLSELARRGLAGPRTASGRRALRGGVPVIPSRGELITLERVRDLMEREGV